MVSDDAARLSLLKAIETYDGPFTLSEMVSRSGLPPEDTERLLNTLVRDYESSLEVTEDGDLIYRFDSRLTARPDVVKADAWRRRKARAKSLFTGFFKAWTIAMVVIYTVIYVCLLLTIVVAASSKRGGRRGGSSSFGGALFRRIIIRQWFDSWRWRRRRRAIIDLNRRILRGDDLYQMDARPDFGGQEEPESPTLVDRTWYHLFGAQGIERTPLETEKELLTYIRANKGIIGNADIMALLGVTYAEADAIGTRLVATYDGELDIVNDAIALYRFPRLLLSASEAPTTSLSPLIQQQEARLSYTWTIREKVHTLRAGSAGVIPWLNLFNLILAALTYSAIMPVLGISGGAATFGLVIFPGLYSALFFALGARRWLRERRDEDAYSRANMRIGIYRLLFNRQGPIEFPGDEGAVADSSLGSWSAQELSAQADLLADEIGGSVEFIGSRTVLRADRVLAELRTARKARSAANATMRLGRTVFSSADPGLDEMNSTDAALLEEIAALEEEVEA